LPFEIIIVSIRYSNTNYKLIVNVFVKVQFYKVLAQVKVVIVLVVGVDVIVAAQVLVYAKKVLIVAIAVRAHTGAEAKLSATVSSRTEQTND
jgi:hypothetical protein